MDNFWWLQMIVLILHHQLNNNYLAGLKYLRSE